jgi:hypothetical protein
MSYLLGVPSHLPSHLDQHSTLAKKAQGHTGRSGIFGTITKRVMGNLVAMGAVFLFGDFAKT